MIEATYIDHMGSDLSVVNAARVSFGKKSEPIRWEYLDLGHVSGDLLPVLKEGDIKLIQYLADHGHYSPFGHCFASFHVKAPIFVARQLVKHEYLRWNEVSRRYVDDEPEFYVPEVWRGRSKDKKQGSDGVVDVDEHTFPWVDYGSWGDYKMYLETCEAGYKSLLEKGVAPEQARMVLPLSTMTEWYWSGSLDAFANMCNLRLKPDTQFETRLVANSISIDMAKIWPVSWGALVK
jgi:thymidylate synthase (FAD)